MTTGTRLAVDTSVAIPLVVGSHTAHSLVKSLAAGRSLCLRGHALAETCSVLTRLPGDARVAAADAVLLIDDNFSEQLAVPLDLAGRIHRALARHGISGGAVCDRTIALAAREHGGVLAPRDARARATYEAVGARVEIIRDTGEPS